MRLALVGISHHRAPVEVRERVAVDLEHAASLARALADGCEAVVLSTCNRTEVYLAAREASDLERRGTDGLLGARRPSCRTSSRRCCTGSATSRPRCTSSGSPPASTRWFRARARSSGRSRGLRGGERRARCSTGSFGLRCTRDAAPRGDGDRREPGSVAAAAAALAQQVFET